MNTYSIQSVEGAGFLEGHFYSYLMIPTPKEEVSKTYRSSTSDGMTVLATGPRGKWSPSIAASIETIRKSVVREIKTLEKNGDLRPSQSRRLKLLKGWIAE